MDYGSEFDLLKASGRTTPDVVKHLLEKAKTKADLKTIKEVLKARGYIAEYNGPVAGQAAFTFSDEPIRALGEEAIQEQFDELSRLMHARATGELTYEGLMRHLEMKKPVVPNRKTFTIVVSGISRR